MKSKRLAFLIAAVLIAILSSFYSISKANALEREEQALNTYQEFFIQNPNGVMGTVDNGEARTRTFQVLWVDGDKIYFCTGNHKPVYEQMIANPKVSFTALNSETMESVSVCGTAVFVDDLAGKARALNENPGIQAIYKEPENPTFELLYIEVTDVSSFIFSSNGK